MSKLTDPAWQPTGPIILPSGNNTWTTHWGSNSTISIRRVENGWLVSRAGKEYVFVNVEDIVPLIKGEQNP